MKDELRRIARRNGQLARVKAGRLAVILKLYHANPKGGQWLRAEAAHLAKSVTYHLRQAALIGQLISSFERKDSQGNTLDSKQDNRTPRRPVEGRRGKA